MRITAAQARHLGIEAPAPKYRAKRTTVDGITFASKKEAKRYGQLRELEQAGRIVGLVLQPRFPLKVNGLLVTTYVADFEYSEGGVRVVEDVKGFRTRDYILKRKMMLAVYGIEVRET